VSRVAECTGKDAARALDRFSSELERTSLLQPLLVALALVAWEGLLSRGVEPTLLAGHSVGEIAAWSAAGAVSVSDAIAIAAARGLAMERAASARPGGMLAVGAGVLLDAALALGRLHGTVALAARNGPSQNVLSGDPSALEAIARVHGGRRLVVSGAWHSPAMQPARDELAPVFERLPRRPLVRSLVSGLDGRVLSPDEVPALAEQMTAPVAWDAVMRTLADRGVTDVVCLAPGRVMRSLARDALGDTVRLHVANAERDLDRIAEAIGTRNRRAS
jgi:[acyl-carrier-protein] S-malonyltransferase